MWNYERSFVLSNFKLDEILRREKQKNKNEKESSTKQSSALLAIKSSSPLSPLSSLSKRGRNSYHVTFFTATSSVSLHLIFRYIYIPQHIYSSHIIFQQSLLISRAFIFREYAHTNRRKDGHDDQQQQRGDDDDDDEKKSSSHVLSIWRKIFCFQCEQRVESSSGEQKNEQSKYHNESIRSRRYHHRRRRVVRERSVAIGDSGLNRFLGHVVWAVQVNQQSGGESGAGV